MTTVQRSRRAGGDRERGAAAVEFALVLPLFLLVVAAIINFGIALTQQLVLNNAVREGARAAVVPTPTGAVNCETVVAKVRSDISAPAMDAADVAAVNVFVDPDGWLGSSCGPGNPNNTIQPCLGSRPTAAPTSTATPSPIGSVKVTAEWRSDFLFPWVVPGLPDGMDLKARAVYQCEYSF